jgi:hypothetical protein
MICLVSLGQLGTSIGWVRAGQVAYVHLSGSLPFYQKNAQASKQFVQRCDVLLVRILSDQRRLLPCAASAYYFSRRN